jgi:hypothetical protein
MLNLNNKKETKEPKEEDKKRKPEFMSQQWLEDFFIPRNFIDVVFILVCFILAWYALAYDIPNAKVPVVCATYWNKWANEKAGLLGGLKPFSNDSTIDIGSYLQNATPVYINITNPVTVPNLTSASIK